MEKLNVDADSLSRVPWQMEEVQQLVLPVLQVSLVECTDHQPMHYDIPSIEPIEIQALNVHYEVQAVKKRLGI